MLVPTFGPTSHVPFAGTSDHLPRSRVCVLASVSVCPVPTVPAIFDPCLCSDLDHCLTPEALLQVPEPAPPWPHEPGDPPRM